MNIVSIKRAKLFSFVLLFLIYLIFIFFIDFNNLEKGYHITIILPIIFLLCFYGLLWNPVFDKRTPYLVLYAFIAFIRYVVLSVVTIIKGNYYGISRVSPSSESLLLAGILMSWELISTSILINYWVKSKMKYLKNEKRIIHSQANPAVYIFFILLIIVLVLIIPQSRQGISLFGKVNKSINIELGALIVLGIRESLINAKYFLLFVVFIILQRNNSDFSKNKFFCYFHICIVCILIIGLRVGANRKSMLADSLAAMLMLWNLFPKYKKMTTVIIASTGIILVVVTTIFRGMTDSIGTFFNDTLNINFLQPYFLGQYNVAIAIEAKKFYSGMMDIKTYILSFLRPLFGIGQLVKNINFIMPANLFDNRMSLGLNTIRGDQILPMIGEGYMLFGAILSPIISIIIARVGVFLDSLYLKSRRIEVIFIASVLAFYLAQGMILNSTIILNHLSFRLAIYTPIVFLGYITVKKI